MVLLAHCERKEMLARQEELGRHSEWLRTQVSDRRKCKRELQTAAHFSDVYDWVCEINKLSDASRGGWRIEYGERFLRSLGEEERRKVLGTMPTRKRTADGSDDEWDGGGGGDDDAGESSNDAARAAAIVRRDHGRSFRGGRTSICAGRRPTCAVTSSARPRKVKMTVVFDTLRLHTDSSGS